jgi:hypothetical protein
MRHVMPRSNTPSMFTAKRSALFEGGGRLEKDATGWPFLPPPTW